MLKCKVTKDKVSANPATTEMVPNLIWAPDFFGPQEVLVPEKYRLRENWSLHENHHMTFSFGDQISRGTKKSGYQMRSVTISVTAV